MIGNRLFHNSDFKIAVIRRVILSFCSSDQGIALNNRQF